MPRRTPGPTKLALLSGEILTHMQKHTGGLTRDEIKREFVSGPLDLEENRSRVWQITSALVSLQHGGHVVCQSFHGTMYYYHRSVV